jgi:hypothetical protein
MHGDGSLWCGCLVHHFTPLDRTEALYIAVHYCDIVDTPIQEAMRCFCVCGLQYKREFDGRHYVSTGIGASQSSGTSSKVLET